MRDVFCKMEHYDTHLRVNKSPRHLYTDRSFLIKINVPSSEYSRQSSPFMSLYTRNVNRTNDCVNLITLLSSFFSEANTIQQEGRDTFTIQITVGW